MASQNRAGAKRGKRSVGVSNKQTKVVVGSARKGVQITFDLTQIASGIDRLRKLKLQDEPDVLRELLHVGLEAKDQVVTNIRSEMPNDPRESWRAVKLKVLKKPKVGGAIAITADRTATDRRPWNPPRKGIKGRTRSEKTVRNDEYFGRSRAFILRFQANGVSKRNISKHKGMFYPTAQRAIDVAAEKFQAWTLDFIHELFGE